MMFSLLGLVEECVWASHWLGNRLGHELLHILTITSGWSWCCSFQPWSNDLSSQYQKDASCQVDNWVETPSLFSQSSTDLSWTEEQKFLKAQAINPLQKMPENFVPISPKRQPHYFFEKISICERRIWGQFHPAPIILTVCWSSTCKQYRYMFWKDQPICGTSKALFHINYIDGGVGDICFPPPNTSVTQLNDLIWCTWFLPVGYPMKSHCVVYKLLWSVFSVEKWNKLLDKRMNHQLLSK